MVDRRRFRPRFSCVFSRSKLRQPELLSDVEQDVSLAFFHLLGRHGAHSAVIEVEPVALVDGKRSVVARPGTGILFMYFLMYAYIHDRIDF